MLDLLDQKEVLNGEITSMKSRISQTRIEKMMSFEWMGQTLASLCWIISVFTYGISSNGDILQLLAASCWMVSNISAIVFIEQSKTI